jgi:IS30 family transposase
VLSERTLSRYSLRELDDIAERINTRSRRVLDWATSADQFWPRVRAQATI